MIYLYAQIYYFVHPLSVLGLVVLNSLALPKIVLESEAFKYVWHVTGEKKKKKASRSFPIVVEIQVD